MKLFCALVLYICFVQMCSCQKDESKEDNESFELAATLKAFYHGNRQPETSDVVKIQGYLNGTDAIKDISPQFTENVKIVIDKYQDNILVMTMMKSIMGLLAETLHGKNYTIDVDTVKEMRRSRHLENGDQMDKAYVLKVLLSKQLPPERVNTIINVILMMRRNATDDEIENTLGYLYGTETQPMTINVEPMSPQNCMTESYAGTNAIVLFSNVEHFVDYFKGNQKINPKAIEDIFTIAVKLPCNVFLFRELSWVMSYLLKLDKADISETEFCRMKDHSIRSLIIDEKSLAIHLIADEILLSTQFPDKDLTDFLNLLRFFVTKTTDEENEKAFEYVYGSEQYKSLGVHPKC
ncbi:uncharacterized protein LOC119084134 [Bradysia coprophila]|uniref:uncharacterized protein LOC119084134 n=1 Tax=Bradysia coprophila TaxID=38358 RepID=UPI00187DA024|nr:uncharacterized protein LOC119084134 [Bradysia coprophila]